MNAKEFLQSVYWADRHIDTCIEELEQLRMNRGRITSQLGGDGIHVSGGLPHSRVEDVAIHIITMEDKLVEEADHWQRIYQQVKGVINRVEVLNQRDLLTRRYLCGQKWEQIQQSMCDKYGSIDLRTVYRWHGAALNSVQAILDASEQE